MAYLITRLGALDVEVGLAEVLLVLYALYKFFWLVEYAFPVPGEPPPHQRPNMVWQWVRGERLGVRRAGNR